CNLNGCVTGLDDLLRNGEVFPHEEVNVRRGGLREFHGQLLSGNRTQPLLTPRRGKRKTRSVPVPPRAVAGHTSNGPLPHPQLSGTIQQDRLLLLDWRAICEFCDK